MYLIGRIIRVLGPRRILGRHRALGPHRVLDPGSPQGPGSLFPGIPQSKIKPINKKVNAIKICSFGIFPHFFHFRGSVHKL